MKVTANGITQHVQRLGPQDTEHAPVVLMIHGLLTDSLASYYFTLGPAFAAAGFDVIMYDLRGHGRSSRPATGYHISDFVDDIEALLDELGVTVPVHTVGNSFGGTLAFSLAEHAPQRIASMAYIETGPATANWAVDMADGLTRAKAQFVRPEVIDWVSEVTNGHTARLARGAGKILGSTSLAADLPSAGLLDDQRIATISTPTLGIYGSESELVEQIDWMSGLLPNLRTVVVPGQEHSVLIEETALSRTLVLDWLNERTAALPA